MQMTNTNVINAFPGYEFAYDGKDKKYHNMYRGTDVGFGGYIFATPGCYTNVALIDVASMHPSSIIAMNCFGEYTKNFEELLKARIAIKHGDFDSARKMLNGRLAPYLDDESKASDLAKALKLAANSCYGLTAANFDNPMRDIRNKNNIVALRGALFMRTLQDEVQNRGFEIVAIRTDSIKIADATKEIIEFCMDFAKQYSYTFEHEATYDRMCQINDADYVARYKDPDWCIKAYGYIPGDNKKHGGEWTATGAQFSKPYTFKKLFTKDPITFEDMCESKEVKTAIYLDVNENLPDVKNYEKELDNLKKKMSDAEEPFGIKERCEELVSLIAEGHNYVFVGKVSNFCPIKPGCGGGVLVRQAKDKDGNIKYDAVTGSKGYRWLETEMVRELGKENEIDRSYYDALVDKAYDAIAEYGDAEWFVSDDPLPKQIDQTQFEHPVGMDLPWFTACGKETCYGCPNLNNDDFHFDCALGHDISDFAATQFPSDVDDMFNKR